MKFSIITPSFNQAQFISQTIDSVITQKGDFEIEYFVMDGGSTDDTVNILKHYAAKLKDTPGIKFYWHSGADGGQSSAINTALSKISGDIVAYINSDDYYEPNIFQEISVNFSLNPHQTWLTGYSHIVNENNKLIHHPITLYKNFWLNLYNYKYLLILNYISQPSTFFKKDLITKFGPFDEKLHLTMDYDFWLKVGKNNNPIILKKYISNFRIHSHSKGTSQFVMQFEQDFLTAKKYTENKSVLLLHHLHNHLINFIYKVIK